MDTVDYVSSELLDKFEFYNYNHALEIITQAFPQEWAEILDCLQGLNITTDDVNQGLKIKETKAAARRPKMCRSRPVSERTIEAV